jgi:3-oxoadipate enol-lactonase/4-carboxymuconolactone decarboxylase
MFLHNNGLNLHVQIEGPQGAAPLLLLHSLGTSLHVWDAQAVRLARRFRLIRPDLRGHGLSGVTPGPYSMDLLAADMLALLDALGVASAHVAGLSIGGMVAQAMAHAAPGRVASLVLCDTAMAIPPAHLWHERAATARRTGMAPLVEPVLARWVTAGFAASPAAEGLRAMLRRTDPEGYAAAAEAIAGADLTAATARLSLPALVIVGAQDQATPVASAEALARALGARLVVLENAAHIPTVEQPEAVGEAIEQFLAPAEEGGYAAGLATRKQVLGDAYVARALENTTAFDRDFQHFITAAAWGGVWARPQLDRRTRSMLTLALLAGLGHEEEFALHLRATRNTGASATDIAEALLHVAVYAGVPAANAAMRLAKRVYREMEVEA